MRRYPASHCFLLTLSADVRAAKPRKERVPKNWSTNLMSGPHKTFLRI
jgi:hypothetical protein